MSICGDFTMISERVGLEEAEISNAQFNTLTAGNEAPFMGAWRGTSKV